MKLITAVFQPARFDHVKRALAAFGVRGLTVSTVLDQGFAQGHLEVYRGQMWVVDEAPRLRVDLVVPDPDVPDLVRVIAVAAASERLGAGRIWVTGVEEVVRIRTGERGEDAV